MNAVSYKFQMYVCIRLTQLSRDACHNTIGDTRRSSVAIVDIYHVDIMAYVGMCPDFKGTESL